MTAPLQEKGYQASGDKYLVNLENEHNPELTWPQSVAVYDEMRKSDPQVRSVMRAVTLPIRRAKWWIDGTGCRPEVTELVARDLGLPVKGAAEEASPVRSRDRFSWPDHLRHALLELDYGHSFFEQTYKIRDGATRLHKLGWRPPRTISTVSVARDGGLVSIEQYPIDTVKPEPIPVSALVAYVSDREGANWLGQSLLRTAWMPWMLKQHTLRVQAQSVDRNGLGVPVYTGAQPPETLQGDAYKEFVETDLAAGLEIAKGLRAGENAGAAIPHGAKLELIAVTGKVADTSKIVQYHDEQIARSVLAHFLNLGTQTGSWALGSTFADFFVLSLQTVAEHVADVTNQHVVEDLVDLNWGESEPAPRVVFEEIGSEHPATADAIAALINCGALTPDGRLEAHLRTTHGLPAADPDTAREKEPASGPEDADPDAGVDDEGAAADGAVVVPDPGEDG